MTTPGPGRPAPGPDYPAPSPAGSPAPGPAGDEYIELPQGEGANCSSGIEDDPFARCGSDIRKYGAQTLTCSCGAGCYGPECCDDYGK